jgi:sec-independent protein translocase protein TatB
MMSGVGFSELLLLFVIGLLILGPERLPRVASQLGRWVGKARRTANQLRFQMEREIALADIERSQKKKRDSTGSKPEGKNPGTASAQRDASTDSGAASDGATAVEAGAGPAGSGSQTDNAGQPAAATATDETADTPGS